MMFNDIAAKDKPWVGSQIGSYNRKFADMWSKTIVKVFGDGGYSKVAGIKTNNL